FDQLDTHLLRQEAVLEIGAVVDARSEHDNFGFVFAARGQAAKDAREFVGVMVNRENFGGLKGIRKSASHDQAVLKDVRDAAGSANIVFQDAELAVFRVADQVDSTDMRVNSARHFDADHFAAKMGAGIDKRARNLPIVEYALLAVDILQKEV